MLRELFDEELDYEAVESENEIGDELAARSTLIAIAQIEREANETKKLGATIAGSYTAKAAALTERAKYLRAKLLGYVERNGKASFPDVGTAYATSTETKIVISDREKIEAEFGTVFVKTSFDETAFRQYAAEQFEKTGLIPDGCDVVAPSKTLAIRKS